VAEKGTAGDERLPIRTLHDRGLASTETDQTGLYL
jgi:hypothetical protein